MAQLEREPVEDILGTMIDREVATILEEIGTVDERTGNQKTNETEQGTVGAAD